MIKIVY